LRRDGLVFERLFGRRGGRGGNIGGERVFEDALPDNVGRIADNAEDCKLEDGREV
jgi:hypothetical protein